MSSEICGLADDGAAGHIYEHHIDAQGARLFSRLRSSVDSNDFVAVVQQLDESTRLYLLIIDYIFFL